MKHLTPYILFFKNRALINKVFCNIQIILERSMFKQCRPHRVIPTVTLLLLLFLFSVQTAPAQECDRECLRGMITQYIDALVGHDPSSLPLSDNVRFTEDSKAMKLGEGLWQTVTAKDSFRQDYLDTKKQVAAAHIVVREGKNQALCAILLYVKDMKITGIETLVEHITPKSIIKRISLERR